MVVEFDALNNALERYEVIERIGRGGMAQVYRAFDKRLERVVALKVMHEHLSGEPSFAERFQREAKFVAGFNHPHIVKIYDFNSFERNGQSISYMVMPYLPGGTLRDELTDLCERQHVMTDQRAFEITRDIASALSYAHKRGMVHRDVKPGNILFDENGSVVLTDFGIARLVEKSHLTQEGLAVGTPTYMSPEQATGEAVDARSDIYALGIVLYEMLTGRPPFDDDGSLSILLKHLNEPPPSVREALPTANAAFDTVIRKAMAKDPADRYQTVDDFVDDLTFVFTGKAVERDPNTQAFSRATPASVRPVPLNALPASQTETTGTPARSGTLVFVTQQLRIITGSPLGILLFGLAVIGLVAGVGFMTRWTPAPDQPAATPITVADNTTAPFFFVSNFTPEHRNNIYWQQGEENLIVRRITEDGFYRIENNLPGRAITSLFDPSFTYRNVSILMEALLTEESAPASGYGIVFRYIDEDNYNVIAVDGLGRYSIWVRQDGVWRELREADENWTPDERINPIGERNRITLDIFDNRFIGYVNGVQVLDASDDTQPSGAVGVYVASTPDGVATVLVDVFSVQTFTPSMTDPMFRPRN